MHRVLNVKAVIRRARVAVVAAVGQGEVEPARPGGFEDDLIRHLIPCRVRETGRGRGRGEGGGGRGGDVEWKVGGEGSWRGGEWESGRVGEWERSGRSMGGGWKERGRRMASRM